MDGLSRLDGRNLDGFGHDSSSSTKQANLRCLRQPHRRGLLTATVTVSLALAAVAQSGGQSELSEYTNAVAHPQTADRLRLLEDYVGRSQSGPLKIAAFEFVVWEYQQAHQASQALHWATQLQAADPDNALALALVSDAARDTPNESKSKAQRQLELANKGLAAIPKLARPLGMNTADFSLLRQQSQARLKGVAGIAELTLKNYAAARQDLRDAVALDPNDTRNLYPLALADLDGKDPNAQEGYWYLARVVNLSKGTAQGAQIASYARNRYLADGGNSAAWDQFLGAATPPGADRERQTMLAASRPAAPAPDSVSLNATAPTTTIASGAVPAPSKSSKPTTRTTTVATRDVPARTSTSAKPAPSIWADDTPYAPPVRRKRPAAAGGPISLGILIETSITSKENRNALVNGLIDMLRHLGDNDEAFILSYDNNLVFETDLTTDPHQLEEALTDIKPQRGAVLDDAVAFAAGHLSRIAKNPNRLLLVISDGRNVDSQNSPLQTSADIHEARVKIFCIGVRVDQADGRSRLQALSSSTGGRSDFISDPAQFRMATREIAQNMGIDFRF